ncbi:MAG: DUF4105 domain-containing protein [Marinilabiliaceae bacterium]
MCTNDLNSFVGLCKHRICIWVFLGILLLFSTSIAHSQSFNQISSLSEDSKISLLTCAPGDQLYSVFGHTAIRVSDPEQEIDMVFNYGTFDFNTPFFYIKFGHGSLDYLLSVSTFKQFMQEYFVESRSVWEQELNMELPERKQLFRDLMINAEPENRAYQYDFFYDNCATRVRDVLLTQHDNRKLTFRNADEAGNLTFREAIHPYLETKPWTKIGIDLILGIPADEYTDSSSIMFLPDHLMTQFAGIFVDNSSGDKPLVEGENQLLDFPQSAGSGVFGISPGLVLWLGALVIIFLSVAEFFGFTNLKILDKVLFVVIGVAGLVIAYLWLVSHHEVTGPNLNILWAHPFWFFLLKKRKTFVTSVLRYVLVALLVFLIFTFVALPQYIPAEFLPVWLILATRLGMDIVPERWRKNIN